MVALSVTEGEDKPIKYPVMFQKADLVLVTKCDLVPHLDVDLASIDDAISRVMPNPKVLRVSARTGEGLKEWFAWLEEQRRPIVRGKGAHMHAHTHEHGHAHEHRHADGSVPSHPHANAHEHPHDHSQGKVEEHAHEGEADHAHGAGEKHEHQH